MSIDTSRLVADLRTAYSAGDLAAAAVGDGGSANMDSPILYARRSKAIEAALGAAGVDWWYHRRGGWHPSGYVLHAGWGQGGKRNAGAEAVAASLRAAGWSVAVWYQVD